MGFFYFAVLICQQGVVGLLLAEAPAIWRRHFSFVVFQQGLVGSCQLVQKVCSEKREFCPICTSLYNPAFALFHLTSAVSSGVEVSLANPAWPNFSRPSFSLFRLPIAASSLFPSQHLHPCVCTEMMKFCCSVVHA